MKQEPLKIGEVRVWDLGMSTGVPMHEEPQDKQIDELEEIQAELRLYGDEAVSDSDSGWDIGKDESL
jgi:hypothetical protein